MTIHFVFQHRILAHSTSHVEMITTVLFLDLDQMTTDVNV